ncbi:MAG: histidinol-phosphatase HisJ family protein [Lachnospiraceae bacterium]|nr:histidinol-phosphatase HisJ family protein [Lachnospiraceae bacterium]
MSIICDFHMHSSFSGDSDTPMEDMVKSAISLGLTEICFTEHLDLDYPADCGDFSLDLEQYTTQLFRLREQYKASIRIRLGLEMGMQPHLGSRYASIIQSYPFDFLIASQHLLDGYDPYFRDFWETHEEKAVYRRYFESILENLKNMPDYDTLGHLDYIVRYGPTKNQFYCYEDYAEEIDALLRYLISEGKCLEVNTAGLKYGLGHPNPEESVLRRYRELGGERITIGSDGHIPEHIAYDFLKAEEILKGLGFRYYTIFRQRKPAELLL